MEQTVTGGTVQDAADAISATIAKARAAQPGAREAAPATARPGQDTDAGGDADASDDDTAPDDAAEEPSIDPPAGWTAADQEWFVTLPPERQERIHKRERELRITESRRENEHRERLSAYEMAQTAMQSEREQYAQRLHLHASDLERSFAAKGYDKLSSTDVAALGQADPVKAADYAAHHVAIQGMRAQQYELAQKQAADWQAHIRMEQGKAHKRMVEIAPDMFGKPETARKTYHAIGEYLTGEQYGLAIERVQAISEWQQLDIVRKAMLYDRAQAAKAKAEKAAPKPAAQKLLRPGAAQTSGDREGVAAADATLRKTGTVDAAAAAIAARMKAAGQRDRLRTR